MTIALYRRNVSEFIHSLTAEQLASIAPEGRALAAELLAADRAPLPLTPQILALIVERLTLGGWK